MESKLGLVLSGGGAKGAYQAGILKYMAERNIQPDMVSGTSIGALNAAVVAAQRDIKDASKTVNKIWKELSNTNPLKVKTSSLVISSSAIIMSFSNTLSRVALGKIIDKTLDKTGVVEEQPLTNILGKYASIQLLEKGLPLYVALYETDGSSSDLLEYLSHHILNSSTKDSEFKHIQLLNPDEMHNAIMASAALPYLFKAKEVAGKMYRDGGMGGAQDAQGNTPAQPLVEAGCTHLIVSVLEDGSPYYRHDPLYTNTAIIEVRPKEFISKSMLDMLAFTPEKIKLWMTQGYEDAKRCIGNALDAIESVNVNETNLSRSEDIARALDHDGFNITY